MISDRDIHATALIVFRRHQTAKCISCGKAFRLTEAAVAPGPRALVAPKSLRIQLDKMATGTGRKRRA